MKMHYSEAAALLSRVCYKPGWQFELTDHSARYHGAVILNITYPARNANRDQAPDYPEQITPSAAFPFYIQELSAPEFLRTVLSSVLMIEEHESREFLRVGPEWFAPFHPHHESGIDAWQETSAASEAFSAHLHDLRFGIV